MGGELPGLRGAQGVAPAPPRGHRGGPVHGSAADARTRPSRGRAGPAGDDDSGGEARVPRGPGPSGVSGPAPERVMARRTHLRGDMAGVRLRRVRHRRRCAAHRGLACLTRFAPTLRSTRSRCCTSAAWVLVTPWRARISIPLHPVYRTPGRGRHRAVGGQRWRFVRQYLGRVDHWPVQHRPVQHGDDSPTRALARPRAGGVRDS